MAHGGKAWSWSLTRSRPYGSVGTSLGHTVWVRTSHWIIALSFLTLAFTGFVILRTHPRLYWGEVVTA